MSKYYVYSGDCKDVVDTKDHVSAAIEVFRRFQDRDGGKLGLLTMVSEQGFAEEDVDLKDEDMFFLTEKILESL